MGIRYYHSAERASRDARELTRTSAPYKEVSVCSLTYGSTRRFVCSRRKDGAEYGTAAYYRGEHLQSDGTWK
jgi:hypothetical protein